MIRHDSVPEKIPLYCHSPIPFNMSIKSHLNEIIGAIIVSLVNASFGIVVGYATIALPDLKLDEDQASWFASIDLFLVMIFSPIGGLISGWIGRKKTLMISSPLATIGWVLIANQTLAEWMLFTGRIVSSIGIALMLATPNVYIAETVHPDIRASLTSLPGFAFSAGLSIIWILGYFWSYVFIAYVATIPSILLLVAFCFLPETPYWLIENGQEDEAIKALTFFRQSSDKINDEINEIQQMHLEKQADKHSKSWSWTLSRFCSPTFLKPFGCIGVLSTLSTVNGNNVLANYITEFMEEAGSDIDPSVGPFAIGILRLTIVGIVPYFVQKMPPRPTFTFGFGLKALFTFLIATFYYFNEVDPKAAKMFNWTPLVMFILIYGVRTIALAPIQSILLSELFPTEIRTLSVGIVQASEIGVGAVMVKMYPTMKASMGMYGLCYFYAGAALFNTIWAFFTIPDNRSKTLVEIEKAYGNKTKDQQGSTNSGFEENEINTT